MGKKTMTSRERVLAAINHQTPDRVPVDLGGTEVTTFSVRAYQNLRDYLGLPKEPCELTQLFMYVAKVDPTVRQMLGIDTAALVYPVDTNNVRTNKLKRFVANDGGEAWIGEGNAWDRLEDGSIVMYPCGNRNVPASTKMPKDGHFFDNIMERLPEWDEDDDNAREHWKDDFRLIPDDVARELEEESIHLFRDTECAVIGQFPDFFLGDAGTIPGFFVENPPKGPRRMDDWLACNLSNPEYIKEVHEMQTEIALKNLETYREAVGDRIQIIRISTADYGTQIGPMISPDTFRELYKPYYKKINDWVHKNTNWKTMYHCCGNVTYFLDDYIDMGCEILNPVQISARGMDPVMLKERWGDKITFWGAGADSQGVLSFGTPDDVRAQVRERLEIFSPGGGYVFNPVHNIMANTSMDNFMAMMDEVKRFNDMY